MKRLFFYIILISLQLLACNHIFAKLDIRGLESIKRLQDWSEYLRSYVSLDPQRLPYVHPIMKVGMQALDPQRLPYVLPIAAAGMQTLALPQLVKQGYMQPEIAQMASLATGIAVPAFSNWLQYQHNQVKPKLANFSYFTPSAIMAALNWIASGRNIKDLPHILLQYLYTLPTSVFASVQEGESALGNIVSLTDAYSQAKVSYEDKLATLSTETNALVDDPTLQLDLKQGYKDAIKEHAALINQLKEIKNISSDLFEQLDEPWMILLMPIIGKLVLENTADRAWIDNAIKVKSMKDMLIIIYHSMRDKQEAIKNILQRGNISELFDYLNHYIMLLRNAAQQSDESPYIIINDQMVLFVEKLMTYIGMKLSS